MFEYNVYKFHWHFKNICHTDLYYNNEHKAKIMLKKYYAKFHYFGINIVKKEEIKND